MTRAYGIERPHRSICGICGEPTNKPTRMCSDCSKSYEEYARQDGSIIEVIGWAARRARWYEQRRKRTEGDLHKQDDALARLALIEPLIAKAKTWRRCSERCTDEGTCGCPDCVLGYAIDALLAAETKEKS